MKRIHAVRKSMGRSCMAFVLATALVSPVMAGEREQAKRIHDRLVGVPPTAAMLDTMAAQVLAGQEVQAALDALEHPYFYSSALKNWVTPWTNEAQTVYAPLNDYTATVIGIVRDDLPFTEVLTSDHLYVGSAAIAPTPYRHTDNVHYEELEAARADLSLMSVLSRQTQSGQAGSQLRGPQDAAGVLTMRAAGEAYLKAGTNRRMWRYTAMNYLCRDMEELNDTTRPSGWVRQDVSRSPGGDSRIFHNTCVGCHSGMDPLAGAFAFFEWDDDMGRVVFTPNAVQNKYLINAVTFTGGYVTVDDHWKNMWRGGPNSALGWRAAASEGNGPKGMATEVAMSRAFSVCQVEKVFERVCMRAPQTPADATRIEEIATTFENTNYSMKRVFAETAAFCMGN